MQRACEDCRVCGPTTHPSPLIHARSSHIPEGRIRAHRVRAQVTVIARLARLVLTRHTRHARRTRAARRRRWHVYPNDTR